MNEKQVIIDSNILLYIYNTNYESFYVSDVVLDTEFNTDDKYKSVVTIAYYCPACFYELEEYLKRNNICYVKDNSEQEIFDNNKINIYYFYIPLK